MKQNIFQKNLPYILIAFPVFIYWFILNKYALNLPHWDDYAVQNSIEKINNSPSFPEKLQFLFAQHNEHRIFLTRLVSLLIFKIKGVLDFRWLMFTASFSLIGILVLFHQNIKKYNLSLLAFIPLPFILLTISIYENSFWGMASLQNFWVIFLAFLTFYLLINLEKRQSYWAILTCFLGVYTSSNGILIPIIGFLILLFQRKKQQTYIWLFSSFLILLSYFYSYKKPIDISSRATNIAISDYFKGLFLTLGSGVEMYPNTFNRVDFSMALGLFLFIFVLLFFYQTVFKKYNLEKRNADLFLLACIAFIGVTSLGITFGRIGFGIGTLLSSKYKIYSILLIMIFYVVAVSNQNKQGNFIKISILGGILFNIYTFMLEFDNVRFQHQERLTDDWNLEKEKVDALLKSYETKNIPIELKAAEQSSNYFVESKFNESLSFEEAKNGFFIVLQSATNSYIFPSKPYWQSKKAFFSLNFILNKPIGIVGFHSIISQIGLKTGLYEVGILKIDNEKRTFFPTTQTIQIKEVSFDNSKQNW